MSAHAEKQKPGPGDESFGAIDVAALMAQVTLETPKGTVTVCGTVTKLWRWPEQSPIRVYGNLRSLDKQSTMSFRCPVAAAPQLPEEHVILRGTLTAKASTKHRGFDLELVGSRIGEWTTSEAGSTMCALKATRTKVPLDRFISKDTAKRLVLIGTETAIGDVKKTLDRGSRLSLDTRECRTGLDSLKAVIAEAAPKYDGLCLIRGGGDPDSFTTWNDVHLISALIDCGKPFYTAIGHSNDLTLADKYADESFGTPSDLGSACTEAWKARSEREQLQRRLAASESSKSSGLDRNMTGLQTAIREFQQLPATLGRQTGESISTAIKASMQDDFSRPINAAIKGPIDDLKQAIHHAQGVMVKVVLQSRFNTWTWLFVAFLFGVIMGGFGYYTLGMSKLKSMQDQLETIQQQTAPLPFVAPPQGSGRRRVR